MDTLATLREMLESERNSAMDANLDARMTKDDNGPARLAEMFQNLAERCGERVTALERAIAIVELVPRIVSFINRARLSPMLRNEAMELLALLSPDKEAQT